MVHTTFIATMRCMYAMRSECIFQMSNACTTEHNGGLESHCMTTETYIQQHRIVYHQRMFENDLRQSGGRVMKLYIRTRLLHWTNYLLRVTFYLLHKTTFPFRDLLYPSMALASFRGVLNREIQTRSNTHLLQLWGFHKFLFCVSQQSCSIFLCIMVWRFSSRFYLQLFFGFRKKQQLVFNNANMLIHAILLYQNMPCAAY